MVLLGGVVVILWILRVSKNAHVLKGRSLASSPLFAALWWYLIPFMSLFKPVESMGEIWDVSAIDTKRRKHNREVLPVWWAATPAAGALAYLNILLHRDNLLVVLQSAASIVQCVAFTIVARRICDMQIEKRTASAFSVEPERPLSVLERLNG